MKVLFLIFTFLPIFSLAQKYLELTPDIKQYIKDHPDGELKSISKGTVGNGVLENGKLIPYKGLNYIYFSKDSYLNGRAFVNGNVKSTVLDSYDSLYKKMPSRYFTIMECSNEEGGEMFPHHTHQNGLSIDFMAPLNKGGKPYYALDTIGLAHYTLDFTDNGAYKKDQSVTIDFDLMARQILILDHFARKYGLKIEKVILKIELKDEFYATEHGQLIEKKGIYLARKLTPLVNSLHDDHFHVDFGLL